MKKTSNRSRAGFTLVEMLVVILIITILLTIGAAGLRNMGGKGVTTGVSATEAVFEEARSVAMGKGTKARVLVDINDPSSDTYLRRIAVVYEELDANGAPKKDSWKLVGRGYTLPEKTFFSRTYSRLDHKAKSGKLQEMTLAGNGGTYNGKYLYYEFNSEGICTTNSGGTGGASGPSFVIGNGVRPKGGEPKATGEGRRDFGGFVIWRNGATSVFREPNQILGSEAPTTF